VEASSGGGSAARGEKIDPEAICFTRDKCRRNARAGFMPVPKAGPVIQAANKAMPPVTTALRRRLAEVVLSNARTAIRKSKLRLNS